MAIYMVQTSVYQALLILQMAHLEQPHEMPSDWRTELSSETRENVVKRITETRTKYVAVPDQEGTEESRNIAQSFEAATYDTATSQADYWKTITQWCLAMEATRPNSPAPDTTSSNDMAPGSQEMLERVHRHWADKVRKFYGFYSAGFSEIFCKYCCWGSKIYCQLHHHISGLGGGGGVAPCEVARPWAREVGLVAVRTEPGDDGPDYRAVFDAFDQHESRNIGEVRFHLAAFHDIVEKIGALSRTIQEKMSRMPSNSKRKRARPNTDT